MTTYFLDEAALELPGDAPIVDRTVHVLEVPGEGAADLRLVVERERMPPTARLADRVRARLDEEASTLRGWHLLEEGEGAVGGVPALFVRARWRHARGPVYHHQAHVVVRDVHLAFVATARLERAEACRAWADAILGSVRFRDL